MIKRIPLLFDIHSTDKGVAKPYKLVKKYLENDKFDEIVIGGDFGHFESISHWVHDKREYRKLEGKRFKRECDVLNNELDFLQKRAKKITYLIGNHEDWIEQYIDKHPEVEGILELSEVLHLKKRKINVIPFNDLYKIGKVYLTHGLYINKYHSEKHMRMLGANVIYGHTHTYQVYTQNMKLQDPYMSMGLGCLCDHEPEYMKGKPANWLNQFGILDVNTRTEAFSAQPINIINNKFIYNGNEWK